MNRPSTGLPFEVVSDEEGLPRPPPRLLGIGYGEHGLTSGGYIPLSASFYLELDDRMLVVDIGEPDEDPIQNLAFDEAFTVPFEATNPGALLYRLGTTECTSTFLEAAPGVTTQVRFGFLDGLGRFSGWTGFYAIEYPEAGEQLWIPTPEPIADTEDTGTIRLPETIDTGIVPLPETIPDDVVVDATNPSAAQSSNGCTITAPRPGPRSTWWLAALTPLLASLRRRRR